MPSLSNPQDIPKSAMRRRTFLNRISGSASVCFIAQATRPAIAKMPYAGVTLEAPQRHEDLLSYMHRVHGRFDQTIYRQLLGACNEFKEGDQSQGIAAADAASRRHARVLLQRTQIRDLRRHNVYSDAVSQYIDEEIDVAIANEVASWTFGDLHRFLLSSDELQIKRIMPGLSSDTIACVVKLMSNDELVRIGSKVFNALPGTKIGERGYLSARVQPNSPTDNLDDIRWQVFNAWSFAVGDALLGNNPVSSEIASVAAIEKALADILGAFEINDIMPHCVLAHVDVQATVEQEYPGSTAIWFQSLAGVEDANKTFDISVAKMVQHASTRRGKYGLYFETGQGADATNGHGEGFDMVIHESRKYGFARALKAEVAQAQRRSGREVAPWVHLNDVAGFIGPEVFRSREQLVRCCLEDIVMGKLHGLTIGLDICSTLHMDVTLDDLDWCIDQIMPAAPAYLMALPTKNDPMLSYLTTSFQDHVRVREKYGFRVSDPVWQFFQSLGVIDRDGQPTEHFGQPSWVYLCYCRACGDERPENEILAEAKQQIAEVRSRGVFIAEGYGEQPWTVEPKLSQRVRHLYEDSKKCIWAGLPDEFISSIPNAQLISSAAKDRNDYILHPRSGESLTNEAITRVERLRHEQRGSYNVQIVISDGLNALAITDDQHLAPYLSTLRSHLADAGFRVSPEHIVVRGGRVRTGYRIGELLFGNLKKGMHAQRAILHIIGERPGSGHHAFSVYMTAPTTNIWGQVGVVDHDITKVISGIADTSLPPREAAANTLAILNQMM